MPVCGPTIPFTSLSIHTFALPFFLTLSLFPQSWQMTRQSSAQSVPEEATVIREAIFSVEEMHSEIYLVLVVEKVLQCSINDAVDVYSKV